MCYKPVIRYCLRCVSSSALRLKSSNLLIWDLCRNVAIYLSRQKEGCFCLRWLRNNSIGHRWTERSIDGMEFLNSTGELPRAGQCNKPQHSACLFYNCFKWFYQTNSFYFRGGKKTFIVEHEELPILKLRSVLFYAVGYYEFKINGN